ncbi:MAG: sulfatase-like hydrolase/transferase [Candidatus Latescibacteria bacterium]|nr:sulfatase-like hydrolase/transferase [Candidatus Latescibacterota bacterium]
MLSKPNVLLISTDHWPAGLFGTAGHPVIHTPTLDTLAQSGVRFPRAYSECPVCIPARRTLMTGLSPRGHGDRVFKVDEPMPQVPTVAQTFRNAGYQAYAVGKLHVYPQRDRIGFDDVVLLEEGRPHLGAIDDYELFLADNGYAGEAFAHGMSNNEYAQRPWHLPEAMHPTNWTTQQMARTIKRRDPTKPGFWYLSYCHPHPPLAPLQCYLDLYRDEDPGVPYVGDWAADVTELPYALRTVQGKFATMNDSQIAWAIRAFYALCTHIDHQLRIVIGTLREEGILDNTIILFTADHGDMLGTHGLWAKRLFYEQSANVPMILLGAAGDDRVGHHRIDDRLVGWQDIMPTLLDLAGIDIPESVEGVSMVAGEGRSYLYGETGEDGQASRMMHDGRYKLIYYPVGNRVHLFDLVDDPAERYDLSGSREHNEIRGRLSRKLMDQLYGGDEAWIKDGMLAGLPDQDYLPTPNRGLSGQRGTHNPMPASGSDVSYVP